MRHDRTYSHCVIASVDFHVVVSDAPRASITLLSYRADFVLEVASSVDEVERVGASRSSLVLRRQMRVLPTVAREALRAEASRIFHAPSTD